MKRLPCKLCGRESEQLSKDGLCQGHAAILEIIRGNLEGAAKSKLPPPKETPPCEDCGGPQKPILFRPEGPWTFYCVTGCRYCRQCHKIHKGGEVCPVVGDERAEEAAMKR